MSGDVRRPKQFEEMLKKICQDEKRIFLTYKDALVFAACLGFYREKRVSFDKSSEPVSMHIFRGEYDAAIFNCMGVAATKDPAIMGMPREAERIKIFEEYACGGLEIIDAEVYKGTGSWDQLLLAMVADHLKPEESVLDDITSAFL
jgi:dnd system-associated protein 4